MAALGGMGIRLGWHYKTILASNVASGIFILLFRPFNGDYISAVNIEGRSCRNSIMYTRLQTLEIR